MDWVRFHLLVNHFPIILVVTATLAALVAVINRRRDSLWRYACVTALIAGLTAPVVWFSGREAEEVVEDAWYADHDQVEEHEELGLIAMIVLLVTAATAAAALRKPTPLLRGLFLAATLGAAALTGMTALEGGEIVHDSRALEERP